MFKKFLNSVVILAVIIDINTAEKIVYSGTDLWNSVLKHNCMVNCYDNETKFLHTFCKTKISPNCPKDYVEYDVEKYFKNEIIFAHNGIRNRIAQNLNVANMRYMNWDKALSEMACLWLRNCQPYKYDPCTLMEDRYGDELWKQVKQNYLYTELTFLSEDFIPFVMRRWYRERDLISPPAVDENDAGFIQLYYNYTQLAAANNYRVGCALARYNRRYGFVCNYLGYDYNGPTFYYGEPISKCPNEAPVGDYNFKYLCTGFLSDANQICFFKEIVIFKIVFFKFIHLLMRHYY